ncbi:hypothetical protein [Nibricoccus sp. IMCC34717]|uniref:hypothetical protein n=1 Tax=Nibricoccus sp. IMCC34717 TaxID=3034021 RepID=UPI0038500CEE
MSAPASRKPWPMYWVVIAIVVFIAGYTVVNLRYRKPGKAHEPYQDAKDKATVQRLISAGFNRLVATSERPAEPAKSIAAIQEPLADVRAAIGGLVPELKELLIDQPVLPDDFGRVAAPAKVAAMMPYVFQYSCNLPDNKGVLGETYVYLKEDRLVVVTSFERLRGELLARTRESSVVLTLPAGTLRSGTTYQVTLVGAHGSKQWSLQVH